MNSYSIRKAKISDIPFLAKTIMEAEKSGTDKFSFSTLFNNTEDEALHLIGLMLEEEIDGCELSISSFLIVEYNQQAVAAFGGWIEAFETETNSGMLKSNLINFTFDKQSISFLITKSSLIRNLQIKRETNTLQLEYLFVAPEHRGKRLADKLILQHISAAKKQFPSLKKAQVQVFKNNVGALKVYQNNGFEIVETFTSNEIEILSYLPSNEKYLMEKHLN